MILANEPRPRPRRATASPLGNTHLTGDRVRRLMRRHHVTIRELSARMGITMKRIRQIRKSGIDMPARVDWEQAIAGEFTPRMRAMLGQWRRERWGE